MAGVCVASCHVMLCHIMSCHVIMSYHAVEMEMRRNAELDYFLSIISYNTSSKRLEEECRSCSSAQQQCVHGILLSHRYGVCLCFVWVARKRSSRALYRYGRFQ